MDTKDIDLPRKTMRAVIALHILLIAILAGGGGGGGAKDI